MSSPTLMTRWSLTAGKRVLSCQFVSLWVAGRPGELQHSPAVRVNGYLSPDPIISLKAAVVGPVRSGWGEVEMKHCNNILWRLVINPLQ